MKYEEIVYVTDGQSQRINIKGYLAEQLENMEKEGEFLCSGNNCKAKLCLVHNSKNGGRTCFMKAVDDEKHNPECEYKINNYRERNMTVRTDGIFTEKQINDAVRRISNDYMFPVDVSDASKKKKDKRSNNGLKKSEENNKGKTIKTASGGKIIFGEDKGDGVAGRMRRRYQVSKADIGSMTTICGKAEMINFNQHKELIVKYKEERLRNIQVILGAIFQYNNPMEFENLYLAKKYFDVASKKHDVYIAAGGLVNSQNGELILEGQANGALRVDGRTIRRMIVDYTKENI